MHQARQWWLFSGNLPAIFCMESVFELMLAIKRLPDSDLLWESQFIPFDVPECWNVRVFCIFSAFKKLMYVSFFDENDVLCVYCSNLD